MANSFNYNYAGLPPSQPNQTVYVGQNGQMFTSQPAPGYIPVQYPTFSATQPAYIPSNVSEQNINHNMSQPIMIQQQNQRSDVWETVSYKKRLRSPEETIRNTKQTKLQDYWLGSTKINNIYTNLPEENDNQEQENSSEKKEPKPPPIYIEGVANINPLTNLLNSIANEQYLIKALGSEQVRVQPKTGETYSNIVKALQQKNTQFHTYKPKTDKAFRVVLKNLHYSTDIDEIKMNLESLGHEVERIYNVKQNRTKIPLSMFFVDLKQNNNNKQIYETKTLMNCSVVFEAPRARRIIPQCIRCQQYGHTKNFCQRNPKCVKCAESHLTIECPRKVRDDSVKCVNCSENHPANYRGCIVHKQLQQKLYPKQREKKINRVYQQQTLRPGISYAHAATQQSMQHVSNDQNQLNSQMIISQPTDLTELKTMMKDLITQMGTMMNLITVLVNKLS